MTPRARTKDSARGPKVMRQAHPFIGKIHWWCCRCHMWDQKIRAASSHVHMSLVIDKQKEGPCRALQTIIQVRHRAHDTRRPTLTVCPPKTIRMRLWPLLWKSSRPKSHHRYNRIHISQNMTDRRPKRPRAVGRRCAGLQSQSKGFPCPVDKRGEPGAGPLLSPYYTPMRNCQSAGLTWQK